MSKAQKVNLDELDDFQKEVYEKYGILPVTFVPSIEEVNNKIMTDDELFQEEIRIRQSRIDFDELSSEEDKLARKASDLLYAKWKEEEGYLSDKEKQQEFVKNTLSLKEQITQFQIKQKEDLKQNPEKYVKELYKSNLDMKKRIANQSIKIRLLEKEAQQLADELAKELSKTFFDRIKENINNILKSLKKR